MLNKLLTIIVVICFVILILYAVVGAAEGIGNALQKIPWVVYVVVWGCVILFAIDYNRKSKN